MPQITTIRVTRKRGVQPEQFGSAVAEVELTGNLLEGEDYKAVARSMLIDSRALVYENLGMKLPASAVAAAKEMDTPEETAKVETEATEEPAKEPAKPKGRGRPKGSKNTAPNKDSKAAEEPATTEADDDDVPGEDDKPQIQTNPENRVSPEDTEEDFTAEDLHAFIIAQIKAENLTTQQAKQVQREMGVVRMRDLDTPEKLATAKAMIDTFIAAE
jgi:hypothetical protein